jgi:hypothetical protein
MKFPSSLCLGFACAFLAGCAGKTSTVDKSSSPPVQPAVAGDMLKITIENDQHGLPLALNNGDPNAHFYVVIKNNSSTPLTLPGTNGILGDLYFEITDSNGNSMVVRPVGIAFSKAIITDIRLAPGESTTQEIRNFRTPGRWDAFPFPSDVGAQKTIALRAIFEEPDFPNAEQQGYWTGKAMSPFYQVLLKHDPI